MKRRVLFGIFLLCTVALQAQKVTNAQFEQVGKQVEITYSLDKQADIAVYVSTDGGLSFGQPLKAVTGDVGKQVAAGINKRIVWTVLDEREKLVSDNVVFKVVPSGMDKRQFTVNGVTFTMIRVEGGTFTMGCTSEQGSDCDSDESPSHQVTLTDYYIGQTEVTVGLWRAVMGSDPSYFKKGDNYPIENVSWDDCQTFLTKLNQLTGQKFSLPTEAQWEYAARGGKKSNGYKYSGSNTIGNVAWYTDNSGSSTHPVGQKSPNELGLYDMSGNVCEWCQDWYGSYTSSSQSNPQGASSGYPRVYRGGSWNFIARGCRVSIRYGGSPTYRFNYLGFRLVLL